MANRGRGREDLVRTHAGRRIRASFFPFAEIVLLVLFGLFTCPAALAQAPWPQITLVKKFTGLTNPTHVTNAGDGSGRLFVVRQAGVIRVIRGGVLLDTPFLDLAGRITSGGERGLLSVAFSPGYATKGTFYVDYTDLNGDTTISRFHVSSNPDVADPASEQVLLKIAQPFANHNGGQLAFGPDGMLYIGMGDGGSGGDPFNNAQSPSSLLGKILRIDVESGASPYAVPGSNPFTGNAAFRPEIWALGLRNPWRFSFDRKTGDLYIGDVGQDLWEEVDFQGASDPGGENYGWRLMEGNHCYNPPSGCQIPGLTFPVVEYDHSGGNCSVTGGFVYRGRSYAGLWGIYFYADFCSGRIWGLRPTASGWETTELLKTISQITTFGEDEAGEVYMADSLGNVWQIADTAGITAVRIVPILLDTNGASGARFSTELTLGNRGTTTAALRLDYTAADALGASGSGTAGMTLGPGRQVVLSSALDWLRSQGLQIPLPPGQGGTLRVTFSNLSSADAAYALARTATPSAAGSGRAGMAYPAARLDEAITGRVWLHGLRHNAADRSNLALVNAGTAGPITLQVTVTSGSPGDGRSVALNPVTLGPGQWTQLNGVLALAGFTNGYALVERIAGLEPYLAYGVFNDNLTNDGSYVPPEPVGRAAAQQMVPVVVETPVFESELVLANPSASSVSASLVYTESLTFPLTPKPPVTLTLQPKEQRIIPGILQFLRASLPGGTIGPRGPQYAGSLRVTFSGTGSLDPFAGARTAAPAAGGGQYGFFCPAVAANETATGEAWIYGLRQDGLTRSNLALVNAGPSNVTLTYEVFDGDSGVRNGTSQPLTLLPSAWWQVNGVLSSWGVSNGTVHVTSTSGGTPFLVYGVLNDAGTNDGSYVAMSPVP
jgi:glucose/arabinose dehydrogenase